MEHELPQDEPELAGRCKFCGAELPAAAADCPECGRAASEGYLVQPHKPIWVRALVWLVLALLAACLLAWIGFVVKLF